LTEKEVRKFNNEKINGFLAGFAVGLILTALFGYWIYSETFENFEIYEHEIEGWIYYYAPIPLLPFGVVGTLLLITLIAALLTKTTITTPKPSQETEKSSQAEP